MNTHAQHNGIETDAASREWFKDTAPLLLLVDIALMFSSIFFNNTTMWVFVAFQCVVTVYAIFVLYLAYRASRVIPPSIPFQRPTGVVLFISAHLLQYSFAGQLPLVLAGYVLFAAPIAIVFLFVE